MPCGHDTMIVESAIGAESAVVGATRSTLHTTSQPPAISAQRSPTLTGVSCEETRELSVS
jgi:hypothetical protein